MKYLIIACIASLVGLVSGLNTKNPEPCKIMQQFYLKGKLVYTLVREKPIIEHKCRRYYKVEGVDLYSDSIVTSLK